MATATAYRRITLIGPSFGRGVALQPRRVTFRNFGFVPTLTTSRSGILHDSTTSGSQQTARRERTHCIADTLRRSYSSTARTMAPANRFDIAGRNYVVTGGAQGIGFQIVETLAESGANVVGLDIKDRPSVDYATLSSRFGVKVGYFQANVAEEKSLTAGFNKAVEFLGSIDGSVTCAGIALEKAFQETTFDETRRLQEINVVGTYHSAQLTAAQLEKQGTGGSIVLIASITSHTVLPHHRMSAYGASKGAVKTLSEALAIELAPHKIRVNSISPGFIDTEMTQEVRAANPKMNAIMQGTPPLQRIGTPGDLTGAIIYLLSDAASYTTGTDIAITGGLHVGRIGT